LREVRSAIERFSENSKKSFNRLLTAVEKIAEVVNVCCLRLCRAFSSKNDGVDVDDWNLEKLAHPLQ